MLARRAFLVIQPSVHLSKQFKLDTESHSVQLAIVLWCFNADWLLQLMGTAIFVDIHARGSVSFSRQCFNLSAGMPVLLLHPLRARWHVVVTWSPGPVKVLGSLGSPAPCPGSSRVASLVHGAVTSSFSLIIPGRVLLCTALCHGCHLDTPGSFHLVRSKKRLSKQGLGFRKRQLWSYENSTEFFKCLGKVLQCFNDTFNALMTPLARTK